MNRQLVTTLILMFLLSGLALRAEQISADSQTVIVPDDYSKIQDAINAAEDGDTIFVKKGTYYETLVVNKSVILIGENKEKTLIDAHRSLTDVVLISSNDVVFSNFTLGQTNPTYSSDATSPSGIHIKASGVEVSNNIIYGVHGPAFKTEGTVCIHDNIVANSGFMIATGIMETREPNDYEAVQVMNMPSPFIDVTIVKGNDVLRVTSSETSFGDIVLRDNATLIIKNIKAVAKGFSAFNNSRLILDGATFILPKISGASYRYINTYDNAQIIATDSFLGRVVCKDDSKLSIDGYVPGLSGTYVRVDGNVSVELNNCHVSMTTIKGNANVTITNSSVGIYNLIDEAQVYALNSNISIKEQCINDCAKFWALNSTISQYIVLEDESEAWLINCNVSAKAVILGNVSNLWVINSTYNRPERLSLHSQSSLWFINSNLTENEGIEIVFNSEEAKINYCWYLSVNVDSTQGTPLENATVGVYLSNGTLVDEKTTDSSGYVQFVAARRIWQNETNEYFVPHTIKAYREDYEEEQTTVDLDSNQEVTLRLNSHTPSQTEQEPSESDSQPSQAEGEFDLIIIISALTVILIGVIVFLRNKK